ncbi:MAG TPA: ATP-binding protein, partial [bacterium]|nr:ATP-binding protein [bacterium]
FTTDKKKGTGIGLALTKKIIESHNGNIRVNSKIGAGTTFVIKLPVIKH